MKKLGVVVALLLLFSFLPGLISCAKAPVAEKRPVAPGEKPPEVKAPPVEKAFKPIKLKYSDYRAHKPGYFGQLTEMGPWMKAVEGYTNGRILIEDYPSGSLIGITGAHREIGQGIAEVGFASGSRVTGIVPMDDVMSLPPLYGHTTAMSSLMPYWFFMYDYMKKDMEALNIIDLAPLFLHSYYIITAKKPIYKMEDIKGVTLISTAKYALKLMESVGAITIAMSNLDGYEALAKGMIDGGVWNWEGPFLFGWVETFKPGYFTDVGGAFCSGGSHNVVMNLDAYNRLPKDLRDPFEYLVWRWASVYFAARIDSDAHLFQKEAERRGIKLIVWSDEEKAKFSKAKEKMNDLWIADMEKLFKRGAEAAELVKIRNELAKKYVPPAPVPIEPLPGVQEGRAEWNKVFGPGSTWGMGYKAYPNQIGLRQLEGNEFRPWK